MQKPLGRTIAALVCCSVLLWLFSLISTPCPGVNETHYLGKALHFWDPAWCQGDLLLESSNAHAVFFSTIGALTRWLPLEASAKVGRLIGLSVFAFGWCVLSSRLFRSRSTALLALGLFTAYTLAVQRHSWLSLSGEWVLGGIEGKVLAWGFGLAAIRYALDREWIAFGVLVGFATSFHPVVGAWMALCVVGGESISLFLGDAPWSVRPMRLVAGAMLSVITAAPGLVPAIEVVRSAPDVPASLTDEVTDAAHMRERADYVQVYGRLKHHLDPMEFQPRTWWLYGAMVVGWLWLCRRKRVPSDDDVAHQRLAQILWCAIGIAAVALVIGYGPRPAINMQGYAPRARFLKLYPFRIADALLPMLLSLQLASSVCDRARRRGSVSPVTAGSKLVPAATAILWASLVAAAIATNRGTGHAADWLSVCQWVRESTPLDALCLTPRESIDFKWFAHRAEFVNYKDCPQDAAGIVEWNRRLFVIRDWRQASIEDDDAYSVDDLARLGEVTGVTYLITHRIGPILTEPVYENQTYRVYELPPPTRK